MRLPVLEKGVQAVRDIAGRQQTGHRVRRIEAGEGGRGRADEGRQPRGRALRNPRTGGGQLQTGAADLLLLQVRQNLPRHGHLGHRDGLNG